ncbi:zinc finger MYND domain-containing protein 10-like [Oscarella lobularis]|uniref:zinc finger MYND domain-containing protein 10-like n=1 Tax=Oscarella lobularis TaxID=121494 RepID=UPI003313A7C7
MAEAFLFAPEAESYVEGLRCFPLRDIGSSRWIVQHDQLEKLNLQAALSAKRQEDEFIKESLVSHEKMSILIYELICIEVWKSRIFPLLLKSRVEPKQTFPCYIVLYHEATLISLLETVLYHEDVVQACDDVLLDLAEYCSSRIITLASRHNDGECFYDENERASKESISGIDELKRQYKQIWFQVTVKAVSILRYIISNLSSLPVSIATRLLNTHDIISCLVELVDKPPWTHQTKDGKIVRYTEAKWCPVHERETMAVTKTEAQVWLALHHLLMDPECQRKYNYSDHRKAIVLKLRGKLNEVLLDQIPVLRDLQRYLEHLAVLDIPPPREELILEQVPEIREKLIQDNKGKWKEIPNVDPSTGEWILTGYDVECVAVGAGILGCGGGGSPELGRLRALESLVKAN